MASAATVRRAWPWWLLGAATVAAVIYIALNRSEHEQVLALMREARPWWLAVAVGLQALTYLAQGESFRLVTKAARVPLSSGTAFRLSLAKLFVDQALPSLGISGTLMAASALERRGLPRPVVAAAMVADMVGSHLAMVPALAVAVIVTAAEGKAVALIVVSSVVFSLYCVGFAAAVLALTGRSGGSSRFRRLPAVGHILEAVRQADSGLARSPSLIGGCALLELAIVVLDVATVWVLIRAFGATGSVPGVFASFMMSNLLRTVSITPGGLGAFEAASTFTLQLAGVSLPVALSATLMFRALSFWLPMVPGLIFAKPQRSVAHP